MHSMTSSYLGLEVESNSRLRKDPLTFVSRWLNGFPQDIMKPPENEFTPVRLRDRKFLQEAQKKDPIYWIWEKDQIKRFKLDPTQSSNKKFKYTLGKKGLVFLRPFFIAAIKLIKLFWINIQYTSLMSSHENHYYLRHDRYYLQDQYYDQP